MVTRIDAGSKIRFIPGIGINIMSLGQVATASNWWLSGGISASNVAGAWAAKGAASLAASYLRLAGDQGYANIDPAIVGGVAPTWDATNGWHGASGKYLRTGITPAASTWSMIVKFAGVTSAAYVAGTKIDSKAFALYPTRSGNTVWYFNGTLLAIAPQLNTGTLGVAGTTAYRNGIAEPGSLGSWSGGSSEIYLMCYNAGASTMQEGYFSSCAIYKTIITAAQVLAVHAAMP